MRIALISAPYEIKRYRVGESLGLKYIASSLESLGHEVDIIDMSLDNISEKELISQLTTGNYPLLGFSVLFTKALKMTLTLAERVRLELSDCAHFTIGGQGISFLWSEILMICKAIDTCIVFEGEKTVVELANCLESGSGDLSQISGIYIRVNSEIKFTGFREPIIDLDSLPFPRRKKHSQLYNQPHFTMLTSRGCYGNCTFCASGNFGNRYHNEALWRSRSPANIVDEMEYLIYYYGLKAISFVDDTFIGGSQEGLSRAVKFADLLLKKRYSIKWSIECRVDEVNYFLFKSMRDAGLSHIFIGIDGGNSNDLKLFSKGFDLQRVEKALHTLKDLELSFEIGFIMFTPITTLDVIKNNLLFLKSNTLANFNILTNKLELYCGSPLITLFARKGLIQKKDFSYDFHFLDSRVETFRCALLKCLRPFQPIEIKIKKTKFQFQTGIDFQYNSNHDKYSSIKILNTIENEMSLMEIEIAEKTLRESAQFGVFDKFDCNCGFVEELRKESLELALVISKRIDKIAK